MMNNTDTKTVRIIPKQPRFISDILKLPARIDEEITIKLNAREIVRCMQYADVYEGDTLLNPLNFNETVESENEESVTTGPVEEESKDQSAVDPAPETPEDSNIDDTIGDLGDLINEEEVTEP